MAKMDTYTIARGLKVELACGHSDLECISYFDPEVRGWLNSNTCYGHDESDQFWMPPTALVCRLIEAVPRLRKWRPWAPEQRADIEKAQSRYPAGGSHGSRWRKRQCLERRWGRTILHTTSDGTRIERYYGRPGGLTARWE